jgi:GntR family transcriptional regulator of arabinose operon
MIKPIAKSGVGGRSQGRLYERVAEKLTEDILSKRYAPNDIIPSERDLCGIMNVSRITVRRALSELARKGWIRSVSGKGNIVTEHAGSLMPPVAILLNQKTFDNMMVHGSTSLLVPLSGVVDECRKLNVSFNIELYDDEPDLSDFYVNRRSLILFEWSTFELLKRFFKENRDYPAVSCFHSIPEDWLAKKPGMPGCVVYDDGNGVMEALEWLFKQGRRDIVYISKDNLNNNVMARKLAYLQFMSEKSLKPVVLDGNIEIDGAVDVPMAAVQVNRARKLIRDYLSSGNSCPDAVLATSDEYAFGAYDALKSCGVKIHEQCVVIGFNNSDLAKLADPPLFSIEKKLYDSGVAAVRILKNVSEGAHPNRIILKSRFNDHGVTYS